VREIREFYAGTLVLAGAMSSGADVLAAQALGADMAYIGTRFLATIEANALPEYKQMLVDSSSDDVVYTSLFTGVKGNYLRRSVAAAGFDPDNLPESDKSRMNFGSGGNMEKKAWRDIWSGGQSVGNIHDIRPVREVITQMVEEYAAAKRRICAG
jgi:nitronate monooxygenase